MKFKLMFHSVVGTLLLVLSYVDLICCCVLLFCMCMCMMNLTE